MFTHTDQKDFKCEICETAFRTKGSLIRHQRRHTGKTKRPCIGLYWVVKVFFMQVFHSILTSFPLADERPYRCNQCGLAFRESGALTRHLKSLTPCTEKIRYSQCKEILVSKDGVRKGNSHLTMPFHNDLFSDRRVSFNNCYKLKVSKKGSSNGSFLPECNG